MANETKCTSCSGSGEIATDYGPVDCPDCGGSGILPSRSVLAEWRARDIERSIIAGQAPAASDVTWLIAELRLARSALTEVVALAHDAGEGDSVAGKIRFAANRALHIYSPATEEDARRAATYTGTVTLPGRSR